MTASQAKPWWIRSDHCVLGGDADTLRVAPARMRIAGPTIMEVVEEGAAHEPFDGVDLRSQLLSPAFINAHTHLSMNAFRGIGGVASFAENVVEELYYRIETSLTAEDVAAFTRMGAIESMLSGVGLVWDHYYFGRTVADTLAEMGLAAVVAPTLQDINGPGRDQLEAQLEATISIDDDAGLNESGVVAALGPHATDTVSETLMLRAAGIASERDLPVHAHVAQSHREYQRSIERSGVSPVRALSRSGLLAAAPKMLLVHGIFISREELQLLDAQRHALGFCPYSAVQFCFPANVKAWEEAKIPWIAATDCAASNDSMNVQKELRWIGGLRGGATSQSEAYEQFFDGGDAAAAEERRRRDFASYQRFCDPRFLLSRVWSVPGSLHPKMPAGVLAAGHLANFIAWDTDHPSFWPGEDPLRALALNDTTAAIDAMMVAGRWVGERGHFHSSIVRSAAYREVCDEATQRLSAARKRWEKSGGRHVR
jgi:5-methylthioadenosine/S-adenosylhomocysteine deaminase